MQKIGERIATLSHNASQMCEEYEGYRLACLDISDVLDEIQKELSQPPPPSNLDEAAEEWRKRNNKGIALCADKKSHYLVDGIDAFKAGAEWMAEQGVTKDGLVAAYDNGCLRVYTTILDKEDGIKFGDKVVVQIRKK